jgi:fructokinase
MLPAGPRAGGAPFNFAFHCHQLGHPAVIVSRVGNDPLGDSLRAEVRRLGMTDEFIQVDPHHPTGAVEVQVDGSGQPRYTIAPGAAWDFLQWRDEFGPLIRSARAVCFGTLAQRNAVSRATIRRFASSFSRPQIKVCDLNLRAPFIDSEIIGHSIGLADWLKVNDSEWPVVAHLAKGESLTSSIATQWIKEQGLALACVTRGENGCAVWTDEFVEIPGIKVTVADTVGAGDAFTAGLLTQILEGKSLPESARFANSLAALVAARPGGTPRIDRAEVERC